MGHPSFSGEGAAEIQLLRLRSESGAYRRLLGIADRIFQQRYGKATRGEHLGSFPPHYCREFIEAADCAVSAMASVPAREKIKDLVTLHLEARELRSLGKRVVLAHGCFDWLHIGHLRHLEEARAQGDILFVTITADAFVKKGPERPIFSALQRAEMVGALNCVDLVAVNDAETAIPVIEMVRPDIFAKGQEYATATDMASLTEEAGVRRHGGQIHYTNQIVYSSSKLIRMTRGDKND